MHLGYFTMPIHPVGKDWRQCLREDREAFILADELGFTEGYVGEHATDAAWLVTVFQEKILITPSFKARVFIGAKGV